GRKAVSRWSVCGLGSYRRVKSVNWMGEKGYDFWRTMTENGGRELIISGGGPAGYTAALYAARANLRPLCIEGFQSGGQLMITSDVDNYPGFRDGILGPELMGQMRAQAERFGTEFISDDVTHVDFSETPHKVYIGEQEYRARAVIVATGA